MKAVIISLQLLPSGKIEAMLMSVDDERQWRAVFPQADGLLLHIGDVIEVKT